MNKQPVGECIIDENVAAQFAHWYVEAITSKPLKFCHARPSKATVSLAILSLPPSVCHFRASPLQNSDWTIVSHGCGWDSGAARSTHELRTLLTKSLAADAYPHFQ